MLSYSRLYCDFRFIHVGSNLSSEMMNCIFELFQLRDKFYQEAYKNRNRDIYKRSFFFNSLISDSVLSYVADSFDDTVFDNIPISDTISNIYLLVNKNNRWIMIILDFNSKVLHFVDGTASYDMPDTMEYMRGLRQRLNIFWLSFSLSQLAY
jgi:hypothetical protein